MTRLVQFVAALLVAVVVFSAPDIAAADGRKSILVTGASTGIGRNLAETLAEKDYHVYAGARKDADLAALDAIENVTAVKLDVTSQQQIDAVVAMIREKGTGLYASSTMPASAAAARLSQRRLRINPSSMPSTSRVSTARPGHSRRWLSNPGVAS